MKESSLPKLSDAPGKDRSGNAELEAKIFNCSDAARRDTDGADIGFMTVGLFIVVAVVIIAAVTF